ncbi:MAG TPA: hypothetical protein VMM12_14645 [Longimicrobiales bacterium]|nr:hypothetical protein [Longimicrobiales bacterium]
MSRAAGAAAAALLLGIAAPLLANGGTVRVSRQHLGAYLVSVMSSPTPLRTGEVDISVLVQDSAHDVVPGVPVVVEAVPLGWEAAPIRHPATRQQATNKFFLAAKFDVETAGEWEFRVRVGGDEGGAVSFQAAVTKATLLDRPYLLAGLILLPLLLAGWLLGRREEREEREVERAAGAG